MAAPLLKMIQHFCIRNRRSGTQCVKGCMCAYNSANPSNYTTDADTELIKPARCSTLFLTLTKHFLHKPLLTEQTFVTPHTEDEDSDEHGPSWPRPAGLHVGWASPWWLPGSDWTAASLEPLFPQQQSNPRKGSSVNATGQKTCKLLSMNHHITLKELNIGHLAMIVSWIVNMSNVCLHSLKKCE